MRYLTYLLCAPLFAQPVLTPSGFVSPEPLTIRTPSGDVPGTLTRLAVDRNQLTVVVLADTLDREKFGALEKTLLLLFPLLPEPKEFTLAVLRGEHVQRVGPFHDRVKLQEELTALAEMIPQAPAAVDAGKVYTVLAKSAPQFAGRWPMVLVAGVFPEGDFSGYLPAYLGRAFNASKVRVHFLTYGGTPPSLPGSAIFYDDARELAEFLKDVPEEQHELNWTTPAMKAGYRVYTAEVGELKIPVVLGEPPALDAYMTGRRAVEAMKKAPSIAAVSAVLALNSRDPEALRTGADLSLKSKDYSGAAAMLEGLTEIEPGNGQLLDEWGNALYLAGRLAEGEKALLSARQHQFSSPRNAEELGRIRVEAKDDQGALTYFAESLALKKDNQQLWLARADAAKRMGDVGQWAGFVEEGLKLGGLFPERRAQLVRYYLDQKQPALAKAHVDRVAKDLSGDAAMFAAFYDELGKPEQAYALWLKTLAADPKNERAHYRVARFLLDQKKYDEALAALEKGLAVQPDSARLYLTKAEALEAKHQLYAARTTIREAAARLPDVELLRRSAWLADAYSRQGAEAYQRLSTPEEWKRGLFVAVRDDDKKSIEWFAAKLPKADVQVLLGERSAEHGEGEVVPVQAPAVDGPSPVALINQSRPKSLDDATASLLAQNFAEYKNFYPYFAALKGLSHEDFAAFFAMGAKLRQSDALAVNRSLSLFAPVVEILARLELTGGIAPARSAQLFRQLCEGFTRASRPQERASASLDVIRAMAKSPVALRELLIGADPGRVKQFEKVLELQKVPSLAELLELDHAAREMAEGKGDIIKQLTVIDRVVESLPVFEKPTATKLHGWQKVYLEEGYRPKRALQLAAELRQRTMRRKLKDIQTTVLEILDETSAQTGFALMGTVYGLYLRPDDSLVAKDPWFLRKHEFATADSIFPAAEFEGSYLRGGLGQFAIAAGAVAGLASPAPNAEALIAAEFGSLRATDWRNVGDDELRATGLRVRLGREWVVQAALDPKVYSDLSAESARVLSVSRHTALLDGIEGRRWESVWKSVTLSDLYFLGNRLLDSKKPLWDSPLTRSVVSVEPWTKKAKLEWLGGVTPLLCGCLQPNLLPRRPYEDFGSEPRPLAQRTAEIKLHLAVWADDAALPASSLVPMAESVARRVFGKVRMADPGDWMGALEAYRMLDEMRPKAK